MNTRVNVWQITSALAAVRSEISFHIKAFLILLPHICCLDSARNQFLSHWWLPNGKASWSRLLVIQCGLPSPSAPDCASGEPRVTTCAVLWPCWFWPDCPVLPYFSASSSQAVISSMTLAQHQSLIAKSLPATVQAAIHALAFLDLNVPPAPPVFAITPSSGASTALDLFALGKTKI